MYITFTAAGLAFEADVTFIPGKPGDSYGPPESEEIEFNTLLCNGSDAEFLMDSTLWLAIETSALDAACEKAKTETHELWVEREVDRIFDREFDLAY